MKSKHFERLRFFLLALVISGIGLYVFIKYPLAGELSKALPEDNATKILEQYGAFDSSKKLFVLVKGFDAKSLEHAYAIKEKLSHLSQVESVLFDLGDIAPESQEYLATNWLYLNDFNASEVSSQEVELKLKALAESMMQSGAYVQLDRNDPLKLFTQPSLVMGTHKDGKLIVPEHGYCIIASVRPSISDMEGSQKLYDEVHHALEGYKNSITLFSPNFYSVENSAYIHNDVQRITLITIMILIGVYFFFLRNKMMLLFSVLTLFLSALLSVLILNAVFKDVSILVIAFGAGIATIAEDYLFMLFLNDNYAKKQFNWSVFWGFAATEIGLFSLVFIDFPLISQLALFAFVSLALSYTIFAFIFPRLQFYREKDDSEAPSLIEKIFQWQKVPPIVFTLLSLILIAVSFPKLVFDSNFRHLDYQNQPLLNAEKIFESSLGENRLPILIYGKSMEALMLNAEQVKEVAPKSYTIANLALSEAKSKERFQTISAYNFDSLRAMLNNAGKTAGFREGMFKDSYKSMESLNPYRLDTEGLRPLGIEVLKTEDGRYVTLGYVPRDEVANVAHSSDISVVDGKELLSHSASNALGSFSLFLGIGFTLLLIIIIAVTRSQALYALNFLFFPIAVIVTMLALNGSYNLMHLFALFLMMVYGIDYGIYLSRGDISTSLRAVLYSCITTFAGFGILVLSDVPAVDSIGAVTIAGLGAILLLFFQKGKQCHT
ncbi:MAG: hypothetical protein PHW18_07745 [Sulfuricurvum sp.]|uniref:hypothetical protein n=1 Tax=Sulfuricurvum sp. TaxID=2025608 RepID=UPI002619A344|nr:hypothetical protein [Sulfuricurvum sp.]MDD2829448.1 hypothetical protein [Sulfuricurvum sp.]MDD4948469.1 hypothetical protein [Sulfuricurvum sp.]